MSTTFVLTSKTRFDTFEDNVSLGDVVKYDIDCSPWAEDNANITTATWSVEYGQASISSETITSNVVSAVVNYSQAGRMLISILIETSGGLAKKMWLASYVKDRQQPSDDYGA